MHSLFCTASSIKASVALSTRRNRRCTKLPIPLHMPTRIIHTHACIAGLCASNNFWRSHPRRRSRVHLRFRLNFFRSAFHRLSALFSVRVLCARTSHLISGGKLLMDPNVCPIPTERNDLWYARDDASSCQHRSALLHSYFHA